MRQLNYLIVFVLLTISCSKGYVGVSDELNAVLAERFKTIPTARVKVIDAAIKATPEGEREGAAFLYAYMPDSDLETLPVEIVSKSVEYGYKARREYSWAAEIPLDIFYNDVLPYAALDETRENWRESFFKMLAPVVANCDDIFEVIDTINRSLKDLVKVEYNTKRRKANQSPAESMEIGMASCSGLSILFTAALRSVGIPSRIAGAPMWLELNGNHNWNELWADGEWYFAEYYPAPLNHSWFLAKCAAFDGNTNPQHQVYAASFKPTDEGHFPLVWNKSDKSVHGYNVTDWYVALHREQQEAKAAKRKLDSNVAIKIYREGSSSSDSGSRVEVDVRILNSKGDIVAKGKSRGANADMNDYLTFNLRSGEKYKVVYGDKEQEFTTKKGESNLVLYVK